MTDSFIGKIIDDKYEVLSIVGMGGMAMVYKARDISNDNIVALKVMKEDLRSNEEFRTRFLTESKAIAMLSHANIVNIIDVAVRDDLQYIVMEYVDGITLKEYIKNKGQLTCEDAVHFMIQMLKALRHAHSKNVVHRDIKPQNIMIMENGVLKVADFGIAKITSSDTKTMSEQTIGSVHYISPEQVSGDSVSIQSDIYSAGVVTYEMLTGIVPFEAERPVSVALMQINDKPRALTEINPKVYKGLEEITLKAMAKNTENRYATTSEMLKDLEEFIQNPKIEFEYDLSGDYYTEKLKSGRTNGKESVKTKESMAKRFIAIITGIATAFIIVGITTMIILVVNSYMEQSKSNTEMQSKNRYPAFVGTVFDELKDDPKYSDYEFTILRYVNSDEYEKGKIVEQMPVAGSPISGEMTVRVVISLGSDAFPMPDINETLTYEQAEIILLQSSLEIEKIEEFNDKVSIGHVIKTEPEKDVLIKSGDDIKVYISKGSKDIKVPNLVGFTVEEAAQLLNSYDLSISFTELDSDAPAGSILSQTPEADEVVEAGTTIKLIVSTLEPTPKITEIPTVVSTPTATPRPTEMPTEVPTEIITEDNDEDIDEDIDEEGIIHDPDETPTPPPEMFEELRISLSLPSDKEYVSLRVECNGAVIYTGQHLSSETMLTVMLPGSGERTVDLYCDNVFIQTIIVS